MKMAKKQSEKSAKIETVRCLSCEEQIPKATAKQWPTGNWECVDRRACMSNRINQVAPRF